MVYFVYQTFRQILAKTRIVLFEMEAEFDKEATQDQQAAADTTQSSLVSLASVETHSESTFPQSERQKRRIVVDDDEDDGNGTCKAFKESQELSSVGSSTVVRDGSVCLGVSGDDINVQNLHTSHTADMAITRLEQICPALMIRSIVEIKKVATAFNGVKTVARDFSESFAGTLAIFAEHNFPGFVDKKLAAAFRKRFQYVAYAAAETEEVKRLLQNQIQHLVYYRVRQHNFMMHARMSPCIVAGSLETPLQHEEHGASILKPQSPGIFQCRGDDIDEVPSFTNIPNTPTLSEDSIQEFKSLSGDIGQRYPIEIAHQGALTSLQQHSVAVREWWQNYFEVKIFESLHGNTRNVGLFLKEGFALQKNTIVFFEGLRRIWAELDSSECAIRLDETICVVPEKDIDIWGNARGSDSIQNFKLVLGSKRTPLVHGVVTKDCFASQEIFLMWDKKAFVEQSEVIATDKFVCIFEHIFNIKRTYALPILST